MLTHCFIFLKSNNVLFTRTTLVILNFKLIITLSKNAKNIFKYMTFLIHAFDYTDAEALNRRMKARESHLVVAKKMHADGEIIVAGAMLDNEEKMIGSAMIVEMDSLQDVEKWLSDEVYIKENVWDKVTIYPMKLALK